MESIVTLRIKLMRLMVPAFPGCNIRAESVKNLLRHVTKSSFFHGNQAWPERVLILAQVRGRMLRMVRLNGPSFHTRRLHARRPLFVQLDSFLESPRALIPLSPVC